MASPARAPIRAIIKDVIMVGHDRAAERAPRGEYIIERRSDGVGMCNRQDNRAFTLSLDAFIQHLTEGRIAYV